MKPSNWIDYMADAIGQPPQNLSGFFRWALSGSFRVLTLSGIASILAGVMEVSAVLLLGFMIDAALSSSSYDPLSNQVWLFAAGIIFFLVIRPIIFGISSYMQTVVVTPNIFNLVLSNFFSNDLNQSIASRIDFPVISLMFKLSIFTHKASSFSLKPLHFSHFVSD